MTGIPHLDLTDAGTYTVASTGTEYESVNMVLDDVTGQIANGPRPVEARPVARIKETDIPTPAQRDRITLAGVEYLVDGIDRDNGMWILTLRREAP